MQKVNQPIHYLAPKNSSRSLCGKKLEGQESLGTSSADPNKVTCRECIRKFPLVGIKDAD